jgi:hypothetical protein
MSGGKNPQRGKKNVGAAARKTVAMNAGDGLRDAVALESDGFNPLARLDPKSAHFFADADALA